jgi:exosortase/archaeosortase family protein
MTRASRALRWTVGGGAALVWLAVIMVARTGVAGPGGLLAPVTAFLASLVQGALAWGGLDVLRHDALLYVPGGFAYEVAAGCTGLLPALVIAAAILAAPARAAAKRRGLVVAVPLVLAVNLLRLVHLFYLGVHAPGQFALAHTFLWEAGLVVFTLGTWLVWWQWAGAAGGGAAPRTLPAAQPLNAR